MMTATYLAQYQQASDRMDFVVKSLSERPGRALQIAIDAGGEQAVQAVFDAVLDQGHRQVLVQALDSPSLPQWVRDKLSTFLYGTLSRRPAALLSCKELH
jgi:hypothetical protein